MWKTAVGCDHRAVTLRIVEILLVTKIGEECDGAILQSDVLSVFKR